MSLGLNDLKKRAPATTSKTETPTPPGTGAVTENWARPTLTARPWKSDALTQRPAKKSRSRSSEIVEASMSNEWADEHTSSLNAFEMEAQSPLNQLHDLRMELTSQAIELERKIKRAVEGPFEILRSVLSLVQK